MIGNIGAVRSSACVWDFSSTQSTSAFAGGSTDWLVMPSIDCHTGAAPDLSAMVATDHWLVFGADDAPEEIGMPIRYWSMNINPALRAFLPDKIIGMRRTHPAVNGDFALSIPDVLANNLSGLQRLQPTGG